MSVKFGLYFYAPTRKYWNCVPSTTPVQGGEEGYTITWWSEQKNNSELGRLSSFIVSKTEAVRRIQAKVRGGYELIAEHESKRLSSILDWMDE